MRKINLAQIIESQKLDKEKLAKVLFPRHNYPYQSLLRILRGDQELSESQIVTLSDYVGMTMTDLFTTKGWKASYHENTHVFEKDNYTAHLNTDTWELIVFVKGHIQASNLLVHKSISVAELIKTIEREISSN